MRVSIIFIVLFGSAVPSMAQIKTDTIVPGKWVVTRVELGEYVMDVEDSTHSLQVRLKNYKKDNSITSLSVPDSLKLMAKFRQDLKDIARVFNFIFKADGTFKSEINMSGPENFSGTWIYNKSLQQLEMTVREKKTQKNNTKIFRVVSVDADKLIVNPPTLKSQSHLKDMKWTLKRKL